MQMIKFILLSLTAIFLSAGCAHYHSSIIEEQPLTNKLEAFKNIVIDASSADPNSKQFENVFSTTLFVQLKESKLFNSVTYKAEPSSEADLILKATILDSRLPPEKDDSIFVADNRYGFKIRYTLIAAKTKSPLVSFSTQSDSGQRHYSVGTSEAGYGFLRSAREVVNYIKLHK